MKNLYIQRTEEQEREYIETIEQIYLNNINKYHRKGESNINNNHKYIVNIKNYNSGKCNLCENDYTDLDWHYEHKHPEINYNR
jgi:hypothetical protein